MKVITIKRKLHLNFLKKLSFACFATYVVQNLPALGRKTEKKEKPN
jgi:hypothetical protein